MARNTEEFTYREEEEHPLVQKLDWKSSSELSHKVLDQIQGDHPELFDQMIKQVEEPSSHPKVSWIAQNAERVDGHDSRLDPESTAGKIFLSFNKVTQDVPTIEQWEPAQALTEYLLRPVNEASREMEFINSTTRENPAFTLEETIPYRIRNLEYTLAGSLTEDDGNAFLGEIQDVQWLSKDLEYLTTPQANEQDFNHRMLTQNAALFKELKDNKEANSDEPNHPSWLSEDGNENATEIFNTFKNSTEDRSPEHRRMAAKSLVDTMADSLNAQNYELEGRPSIAERHAQTTFIDPRSYDDIMHRSMEFFYKRTVETKLLTIRAMETEDQGEYQQAMDDLRGLRRQLEGAMHNGYSPTQQESHSGDYSHDPEAQEMLDHIEKVDRDRGILLDNRLYEFTAGDIPDQHDLSTDQWTGHPSFENAFREFTAQMLPGDRERLISSITERPEHSDQDALRERLNAIIPKENE